jgi:hypothetical protein
MPRLIDAEKQDIIRFLEAFLFLRESLRRGRISRNFGESLMKDSMVGHINGLDE